VNNRAGTLAKPYTREDGVRTVKFNTTLSAGLVSKLKLYTLKAELSDGVSRNEWIEAALYHCIRTGFMPPQQPEFEPEPDLPPDAQGEP
jgi:hypothetical protein